MLHVIEAWLAFNLAVPIFLLYQRSPQLRRRLFCWAASHAGHHQPRELARVPVSAAHRRR